jgi:uncharacterized protein YcaQ
MPPALRVTVQAARRFQRRALLLDRPAATVGEALAHLGYVQIDPINVCGRMHDLILRNRVAGYCEGDLLRYLYGDTNGRFPDLSSRTHPPPAFEHHLPGAGVLAMLPLGAWPHLRARMRHRRTTPGGYAGRLSAAEESLARRILREIADRGPLGSDDIDHDSRALTAWGTHGRMAKAVLDKLFIHGRVLICRRDGIRRVYNLPERVLPSEILTAFEPSHVETLRWLVLLRLRQRRLAPLTRGELPVVEEHVQPVGVDGCPPLYCLREDTPLLAACAETRTVAQDSLPVTLLAPLDPLIYDRLVTRRLWDFDYAWEAYAPPAKRKRGHYALPVLVGTELIGHVNPKADREARRLHVLSRSVRRGYRVAPAVRQLARFLGLKP